MDVDELSSSRVFTNLIIARSSVSSHHTFPRLNSLLRPPVSSQGDLSPYTLFQPTCGLFDPDGHHGLFKSQISKPYLK